MVDVEIRTLRKPQGNGVDICKIKERIPEMSIYVSNSECRLLVAKENAAHVKANILEILDDEAVKLVKTGEDDETEQLSIEIYYEGAALSTWPDGDRNASLDRQIGKILRLCELGSCISFDDEDEGVSIRYAKQSVGMIRERCECAYFEEEDCDE